MVWYDGWGGAVTGGTEGHHNIAPNMFMYVTSGGTTVPKTLLGFTDMATTPAQQVPIPRIALSVGLGVGSIKSVRGSAQQTTQLSSLLRIEVKLDVAL
jgi:hypothetical protein